MIIGIGGWARAGKDTVADFLVHNHGFKKMSFADPMREALVRLNPTILVGDHYSPLATAVRLIGWEELKVASPDIRPLLQRFGTEVGRKMFGENFWVDIALKEAAKYENVVFADCRFLNEVNALHLIGGETWRVNRPGFDAVNDHVSEHELDDYKFHRYLDNSGDLNHLHTQVSVMVDLSKTLQWL